MGKPTDSRSGAFTLRVDCPACGLPVPLNAPAERAHCHSCTKDFDVPARVFVLLLSRFDDQPEATTPFTEGAQALIDGLQAHATRAGKKAACAACGEALATSDTETTTTTLTCGACKAEAIGMPAPAWLTAMVSTARYVIVTDTTAAPADANGADRKSVAETADRPIALPCTQCGAPLHVTRDSERTVPCEFCKTDVYLPDDLWRRMHPVKTMSPWFVRFEGESRAQIDAARAAEARLDALVAQKEVSKKARAGCLRFLLIVAAVVVLGIVVLKMATGRPPPPPKLTGAELFAVARTSLKATPEELAERLDAKRTNNFLYGSTMKENGWFRSGHPCNGTVCIDTKSDFWGRVEVWWDVKHPDHPSGFTIAMQPGRWVETNDYRRKKIGDQLPNGLDTWGHWYRWSDRDILIDRNAGVKVWVTADDETNPEWRTQFDAAWKLLMGVLFGVDTEPTPDELRALIAPTPAPRARR